MKGAAKCDNHCELQNSVNQLGFERILRFRDIPESMLTSVPIPSLSRVLCPFGVTHIWQFLRARRLPPDTCKVEACARHSHPSDKHSCLFLYGVLAACLEAIVVLLAWRPKGMKLSQQTR